MPTLEEIQIEYQQTVTTLYDQMRAGTLTADQVQTQKRVAWRRYIIAKYKIDGDLSILEEIFTYLRPIYLGYEAQFKAGTITATKFNTRVRDLWADFTTKALNQGIGATLTDTSRTGYIAELRAAELNYKNNVTTYAKTCALTEDIFRRALTEFLTGGA